MTAISQMCSLVLIEVLAIMGAVQIGIAAVNAAQNCSS